MSGPWQGKTVVISGGTKGLGEVIAMEAASQNAHVIVIGRAPDAVDVCCQNLREAGALSAVGIAKDGRAIHESSEFRDAIDRSGIDLLVNAVGRSDRGTLEQLTEEDLQAMFRDNVLVGWNVTKTCLPALERNRGCIANIGSLAGLIATPNLGAYCVTKFAWTALSRQWRMELQQRGVHLLLVSPGPIAREDSSYRYRSLAESRGITDTNVQTPGGGAKLKLLPPDWLARSILAQAHQRRPEWVVPWKAKILCVLMPFCPTFAETLLRKNLR